jgi:hypothetical protein
VNGFDFMPTLDIAMPIALFMVILAGLFLNERVERKFKATVEQKEFKTKDVILLVTMITVTISVIAYISMISSGQIFQNILVTFFLLSYSILLFTFSYVLSNISKKKAQIFSFNFVVVNLIVGVLSLLGPVTDALTLLRAVVFFSLAIVSFGVLIIERKKTLVKERWLLAIQPPALFLSLFLLFNIFYDGSVQIWFPILLNIFAFIFAILIILYLGSMFTWKTAVLFAILLTIVDIILVIGTGAMVTAARQFTGLGLPVLVYLPNVPLITASSEAINFFGFAIRGLGLGDFFFAGILALQTLKRFDKKTAIIATIAMTISFGIFAMFLRDMLAALEPIVGREIGGFPGTLMIICGWLPIVAWKLYSERKISKN